MATVLLGEDDSGDLGQRPGQASWGEGGLERDTHTPASMHTAEHTQAQGPLMSPLLSFAFWCWDPDPPLVTHPVMSVTCEGTRGTGQLLFCWPHPRAAPEFKGRQLSDHPLPGGPVQVGTRRGQPSPQPRPSMGLSCLSGLSQAGLSSGLGQTLKSCARLPGFLPSRSWAFRSGARLPATTPLYSLP